MSNLNTKLQYLMNFYQKIDTRSLEIIATLAEDGLELHCRKGCHACCHDDLSVTPVEAELIRSHFEDALSTTPHPKGKCAFLDEQGLCRIYPVRPYICRSQGLPLRWIQEDPQTPELDIEYRDICELNAEIAPDKLDPQACFSLGLPELTLQEINALHAKTENSTQVRPKRVALRSLFLKQ